MIEDILALPTGPGTDRIDLPDVEPHSIAEAAVALVNTGGGLIAFPPGTDRAELDRALDAAASGCQPAVPFGQCFDLPPADDRPARPALHVPRGERVYALADGRVLVRVGARSPRLNTRELNGDEIRQLISVRRAGDFEAEAVPGATVRDLDAGLIAEFIAARSAHTGGNGITPETLLRQIGALRPDGGVTVAGLLLFGRDPARWLPDAGAQFVRLVGDQRACDERIDGPLVHVARALWDTLQAQTLNTDQPDYPPAVLREMLFNAITHRDYRLRGAQIVVTQHRDRLAITSPGGLPGYLTNTAQMLGARFRRNPRIQWALAQWGADQDAAPGIMGAILALGLHGSRPPEIESGPYAVTVRLYSARAAQPDSADAPGTPDESRLTPRQRDLLAYVRARGSITLREARVYCDSAHPAQLAGDLAALVEAGLLRKIGAQHSAYYILA